MCRREGWHPQGWRGGSFCAAWVLGSMGECWDNQTWGYRAVFTIFPHGSPAVKVVGKQGLTVTWGLSPWEKSRMGIHKSWFSSRWLASSGEVWSSEGFAWRSGDWLAGVGKGFQQLICLNPVRWYFRDSRRRENCILSRKRTWGDQKGKHTAQRRLSKLTARCAQLAAYN